MDSSDSLNEIIAEEEILAAGRGRRVRITHERALPNEAKKRWKKNPNRFGIGRFDMGNGQAVTFSLYRERGHYRVYLYTNTAKLRVSLEEFRNFVMAALVGLKGVKIPPSRVPYRPISDINNNGHGGKRVYLDRFEFSDFEQQIERFTRWRAKSAKTQKGIKAAKV